MERGARLCPAAVPARCSRSASPLPAVTGSEPRATTTASRVEGVCQRGEGRQEEEKKKSKIKPEETAAKCGRGRGATRGGGAGPLPRPGAALPPRPGNPRLLVRDRADKIPCSPLRNALSKADAIFCVADVDIDKRRHISPPSCFSPFTQTCDREAAGSGKRARGERRHGHK